MYSRMYIDLYTLINEYIHKIMHIDGETNIFDFRMKYVEHTRIIKSKSNHSLRHAGMYQIDDNDKFVSNAYRKYQFIHI